MIVRTRWIALFAAVSVVAFFLTLWNLPPRPAEYVDDVKVKPKQKRKVDKTTKDVENPRPKNEIENPDKHE